MAEPAAAPFSLPGEWEAALEAASGEIDLHLAAARQAVLTRLGGVSASLRNTATAAEETLRAALARTAALERRAERLEQALYKERARSERSNVRILAHAFRVTPTTREAFLRWVAFRAERVHKRAAERAAATAHARRVARAALATWRSSAHASFRARVHVELETRWSDGAAAEAAKALAVVARLQAELADERAGREMAEGRYREAFLRGVSTLSLEALTIFRQGHTQRC